MRKKFSEVELLETFPSEGEVIIAKIALLGKDFDSITLSPKDLTKIMMVHSSLLNVKANKMFQLGYFGTITDVDLYIEPSIEEGTFIINFF